MDGDSLFSVIIKILFLMLLGKMLLESSKCCYPSVDAY